MGKLEAANHKSIRRTKINKAILATVATSGLISVAIVAPNVLVALGQIKHVVQRRLQIRKSIDRLARLGYLEIQRESGTSRIRITDKGKFFLASCGRDGRRKKWDQKWRLVIYDIQGRAPVLRQRIKELLTAFGFVRLQNSVWISPHNAEDLVTLLKAELRIGKNLLYMIVDHIENEAALRAHFSLPKLEKPR